MKAPGSCDFCTERKALHGFLLWDPQAVPDAVDEAKGRWKQMITAFRKPGDQLEDKVRDFPDCAEVKTEFPCFEGA